MTTRAEIRTWVQPLLAWRSDLVLVRDLLLFKPVRHILRGACFWPGGSKNCPNVGWFIEPLFFWPGEGRGLRLIGD
jgi:hypothetical protein